MKNITLPGVHTIVADSFKKPLAVYAMIRGLSFQEMYDGIVRKDSSYEGVFFTAVKTTGIFCRPVCTARKPKPENVVFYETAQQAILNGYRPCRVCKPLEMVETTPAVVRQLIDEIAVNPGVKLRDEDLRKRKIDPVTLRRWFKKTHNMSFQAFQRMMRINSAFLKINAGESVTSAAFDTGYDSLSGFNESFRTIVGHAPTVARETATIHITRFATPLGPMVACATTSGICLLEFADRRMLETEFNDLKKRLRSIILPGENKYLVQVEKEITEYFAGTRRQFTVNLHLPGTAFQQRVWNTLQAVPYGSTTTYKELASENQTPEATRAVASANGHNRVAIIVPCHRIIGANGDLTGYGGGIHRKRWLIDFEQDAAGKFSSLKSQAEVK